MAKPSVPSSPRRHGKDVSAIAPADAPLLGERIEASADPIVAEMLGSPLPAEEAEFWAGLTAVKRENAKRRLMGLKAWLDAKGEMSVPDAAVIAGTGVSRFYRLVADWRRRKSIASLGVLATADRSAAARLTPEVNGVLLAEVVGVVADTDGRSVRAQVALLRERAGPKLGKSLPKETRLRQYVDQERKRRQARKEVGNLVVFDCAACSLSRADGRPWVLFMLLDRSSGLVLGFQLGETERSAAAFVEVADDSLRRMGSTWAEAVAWAGVCLEIDAVVGGDVERGEDIEDWWRLKRSAAFAESKVNLGLSDRKRRHGRYIRKLVGPSLGRLVLSSAATADQRAREPGEDGGVGRDEALMVIEAEVARYNRGVTPALASGGISAGSPPANLVGLFQAVVRQGLKLADGEGH